MTGSRKSALIYIYGKGKFAALIDRDLKKHGIFASGYVVDDEYACEGAITRSELLNSGKPYGIIRGIEKSLFMSRKEISSIFPGCVEEFSLANVYESAEIAVEPMPETFYEMHKEQFDAVLDSVADSLSRESLNGWLHAKISGDGNEIYPFVIPEQYFFQQAPWHINDSEVFVDCGAYDGDTIAAFLKACNGKYKRIIAFEPESDNYKRLCDNLKKWNVSNAIAVNKGAYNKSAVLRFSSRIGSGSFFSEEGDVTLEVDSIDHILDGQKASIIKMDIEGSEAAALDGAKETIVRYRPILMICAYHKRDDVYRLFKQINQMVSGYQFFFRCHMPLSIELVLYAVPEERITK